MFAATVLRQLPLFGQVVYHHYIMGVYYMGVLSSNTGGLGSFPFVPGLLKCSQPTVMTT